MSSFTREEIDALKRPFALKQHNIREGYSNSAKTKIRWFPSHDRARPSAVSVLMYLLLTYR